MTGTFIQALRALLGIGCLILLWHLADGAAALRYLAAADTGWMAAALLALTMQTLLSALRWRLTARQLGIDFNRRTAVHEYYLSQLVNQLLPGGVLGDAGRAFRARAQAGLLASGQAVVFERLAGQLGLLGVFVAGAVGAWVVPGGFWVPEAVLYVAASLVLGCAVTFALCQASGQRQSRLLHCVPVKARHGIKNFIAAFAHSLAARDVRISQVLLSVGTALCNITAFACCVGAVGANLSIPAALVLVPIILLTMLLPLTPGGWGFREGAAAALLPLAGVTSTEALAASVAFGLVLLVATLPGLVVLALGLAPGPVKT